MSMRKRLADIVTRFRVDGARQAGAEMQSVSAAAAKAARATDGLSGTGAAQIAGAAGAAAGQLDEVRDSALAAKKAIAEIGAVKVGGRGLDLGLKASGKDAAASASAFQSAFADTQRRVAATSLAGIDTSKIAPNVDRSILERALKSARQAAGEGMPIDVYVDPASLVRVEKDVLKALDDVTPNIDFSNVDRGALKRAGVAMSKALASGMKLDEFVDAQTAVAFSGEQLAELARTGYGAGEALEDVAEQAKKTVRAVEKIDDRPITAITDESRSATRGFRQLASGSTVVVRGLGAITRAGTTMGRTLVAAARRSAASLKTLGVGAAGIAAGQGLSAGAATGFAIRSGQDTIEKTQQSRSIAALTGMDVAVADAWERYGAQAGLQDTDLAQVFSGFVAAIRDAEDPASNVAKIFAQLGVRTKDAAGNARAFSHIFAEFLRNSQKLSAQNRGGAFTQVFGEDDALKVAELSQLVARDYGQLNANFARDNAEGRFVSQADLAQIKQYQAASLKLGNTWASFRRKVFLGVEPILTRWATFAEGELFKRGEGVIRNVFVRPVQAADRAFQRLYRFFQDTNEFERARKVFVAIGAAVRQLGSVLLAAGRAFAQAFPGSGTTALDGFAAAFEGIRSGLVRLEQWFIRSGAAAFRWTGAFIRDLAILTTGIATVFATVASEIDQALLNRGIDWRAFFAPENLAQASKAAVQYLVALFRDVGRLLGGQTGFLETGLARWAVVGAEKAKEYLGQIVAQIRAAVTRAIADLQKRIDGFLGYFRTSFAEFQSAMSGGLAIEDMSTRLGQLMAILGQVVDYLVRLSSAFRDVVVEGKKAPAGFEWLETVAGIAERLGGAITNIFNAIRTITQPLDEILKRMGLWDTATIALAGLIVGKIAAAFGTTVVGAIGSAILAAKKLMGILGLGAAGGAAAGAAAASGTAAGAAGAAGAGATGGILAGVTAIGVALGKTLLKFTPIVGALAGITAGFYAVLQQADRLMPFIDKLGGALGLKTQADVEVDVAGIRAQMDADYARYGGKPGNGILRPAVGGSATADAYQLPQNMRQFLAEYGRQVEPAARPTSTVNIDLGGDRVGSLSGTTDQISELTTNLQRARARKFG